MTAFKGAFEALRNAVGVVDADRILTAVEAEACADKVAEIDRLRAELDSYKDHLGHLERHTLPQLRREIQHHQDGKKRWRDRAEKAEARVAELERPAVEARRNEIRSTYTELISQAEQDSDFEGAATLTLQLRESEEKWATEDAKGGVR